MKILIIINQLVFIKNQSIFKAFSLLFVYIKHLCTEPNLPPEVNGFDSDIEDDDLKKEKQAKGKNF